MADSTFPGPTVGNRPRVTKVTISLGDDEAYAGAGLSPNSDPLIVISLEFENNASAPSTMTNLKLTWPNQVFNTSNNSNWKYNSNVGSWALRGSISFPTSNSTIISEYDDDSNTQNTSTNYFWI